MVAKARTHRLSLFGRHIEITTRRKDRRWSAHAPRVLVIVPHYDDIWARNAFHGIYTYFLNTDLSQEEMLQLEIQSSRGSEHYLHHNLLGSLFDEHRKPYDAIVTVGNYLTTMVKNFLAKNDATIPLFFCGAKDPDKTGIVSSLGERPENITGVVGVGHDFVKHAETLLALKKDLKKVTFVSHDFDFTTDLIEEDQLLLKACFEKNDVEVKHATFSHLQPILHQLEKAVEESDAICTFRDILLFENTQDLIKLCNKHDTTMFTSELASVRHGAAAGYGDTGHEYGARVAALLDEYLYCDVNVRDLEVIQLRESGKFRVNKSVIGSQGLHLDRKTTYLVGNTAFLYDDQ